MPPIMQVNNCWEKIRDVIRRNADDIVGTEQKKEKRYWFHEYATNKKNKAWRKMKTRRTQIAVKDCKNRQKEEKQIHKRKKKD